MARWPQRSGWILLLLCGCADVGGVSGVLAGHAPDAGGTQDAADTGALLPPPPPPPVDAGQIPDAAPPPIDAGPPDSGEIPDAGRPEGFPTAAGPVNGIVMVHGGGGTLAGRTGVFFDLVDDASAPVVVVPTAQANVSFNSARASLTNVGFTNVTVLHTRSPSEADTEAFVEPLTNAAGVWFSGGRQWRLADAYLGTRFMTELQGVLDRGGVVGGTSAGASIMGSFLIRGDTGGNTVLIGDHTEGFGFLINVGVDQHVAQRGRETDLYEFVDRFPDQLGIGLDEPIAAIFRGNMMEIVGQGSAYVHYRGLWAGSSGRFLRLSPGDRYDILTLELQ